MSQYILYVIYIIMRVIKAKFTDEIVSIVSTHNCCMYLQELLHWLNSHLNRCNYEAVSSLEGAIADGITLIRICRAIRK